MDIQTKQSIINMIENNESLKTISETLFLTIDETKQLLEANDILYTKRTFPIKDTYFDIIDTEEKAYLLGYLIADGCIKYEKKNNSISYRIAIHSAEDDLEVINLFHNAICPKASLIVENHANKKKQYTCQFNSAHMCRTLNIKYHIKPRKTFDKEFYIPDETIPDNLWRHFIRGYFDGDGHVNYCKIEFIFTSKPFMEQILQFFQNFNYKIVHIQGKTTDYYRVMINLTSKYRKCLYDFFYKDANYYLTRKYNIFNTEISYHITNRVIDIVEHRVE